MYLNFFHEFLKLCKSILNYGRKIMEENGKIFCIEYLIEETLMQKKQQDFYLHQWYCFVCKISNDK